jgi:hypothetical protein
MSSVPLLHSLIATGASVRAYDPVAIGVARRTLPAEWLRSGQLALTEHQYDVLDARRRVPLPRLRGVEEAHEGADHLRCA